ncbi:MAG: hypothetical protein AB8H80_00600 [Planctomycetota bacterium]
MQKQRLSLGLVAVSSCLALTASLSAQSVHRIANGQAIQPVIDSASPGDILVVSPGTYPEAIDISKSLVLVSELDILGLETNLIAPGCDPSSFDCNLVNVDSVTVHDTPQDGRVILKGVRVFRDRATSQGFVLDSNQSVVWIEGCRVDAPNANAIIEPDVSIANAPASIEMLDNDEVHMLKCSFRGHPRVVFGNTYEATAAMNWISASELGDAGNYLTVYGTQFFGGSGAGSQFPGSGADAVTFATSPLAGTVAFYFGGVDMFGGAGVSVGDSYSGTGSLTMFQKSVTETPTVVTLPNVDIKTLPGIAGGFIADTSFTEGQTRNLVFGHSYDVPTSSPVELFGMAWSLESASGAEVAMANNTCTGSCPLNLPGTLCLNFGAPSGVQNFGMLPIVNGIGGAIEPFTPNVVNVPLVLFGQGYFVRTDNLAETWGSASALILLPAP